ncbi:isoaspartyl peptidase/L-asparaginase [Halegenticoccus tardaugens]|uniref:isoaspartyl peptidase/L-asparaginase n=1 Tax=Halegenticoccus tardaugens TaxID=2071624 RepID=UPI00100AAB02|nr:isoaspartyl peptidase/L-asparaginase [Halegenticoccus tardaugens]
MHVIVHGGAGGVPDDPGPRQAVLDAAAARGTEAATPLDAVEAAVNVLESDERFNAGVGGAVQSDGVVRTDAGIMTSDRAVGAAAGMPGVERAVSVARVVMEETPHVLVAGERAVDLAADFGVETGVDLLTARSRERWEEANPPSEAGESPPRAHLAWLRDRWGDHDAGEGDSVDRDGGDGVDRADRGAGTLDHTDHDTVGAVASDGETFAAATSTGGRWFALAGRVGDVPQVGSGFYCAPAGGASATGFGEDIARVTLSRRAVSLLERGLDAETAAHVAIEEFGELTGSEAGLIVLDADGAGSAYNSDGMQTAVARS